MENEEFPALQKTNSLLSGGEEALIAYKHLTLVRDSLTYHSNFHDMITLFLFRGDGVSVLTLREQ